MITRPEGFSRSVRLTEAAEYRRVFQNPMRAGDRHFTVLAVGNQLDHSRLGLAISKKNIRRSSGRNLVKRIVRESFRCHQADIGQLDIVVLAKHAAASADRAKLRQSIDRQWAYLVKQCAKS